MAIATPGDLTDDDLRRLFEALDARLRDQERVRIHYVSCSLSAWPVRAFAIGAVRF